MNFKVFVDSLTLEEFTSLRSAIYCRRDREARANANAIEPPSELRRKIQDGMGMIDSIKALRVEFPQHDISTLKELYHKLSKP